MTLQNGGDGGEARSTRAACAFDTQTLGLNINVKTFRTSLGASVSCCQGLFFSINCGPRKKDKKLKFRAARTFLVGKSEAGEAHSNSLGCLLETMMSRILFFAALLGQLVNGAHGFLAATFVLRLARHAGKVGNTNLRRYSHSSRPCSRACVCNL